MLGRMRMRAYYHNMEYHSSTNGLPCQDIIPIFSGDFSPVIFLLLELKIPIYRGVCINRCRGGFHIRPSPKAQFGRFYGRIWNPPLQFELFKQLDKSEFEVPHTKAAGCKRSLLFNIFKTNGDFMTTMHKK